MSEPFIAEVKIFAGNFAPRGYAFCSGALLPISQNTALFSLIGTIYGGDGRTTTGLPTLRGRAAMHPGRGPGLTSRRLGEKSGVDTVTLIDNQMANHTHTMTASGYTAPYDTCCGRPFAPEGPRCATTEMGPAPPGRINGRFSCMGEADYRAPDAARR